MVIVIPDEPGTPHRLIRGKCISSDTHFRAFSTPSGTRGAPARSRIGPGKQLSRLRAATPWPSKRAGRMPLMFLWVALLRRRSKASARYDALPRDDAVQSAFAFLAKPSHARQSARRFRPSTPKLRHPISPSLHHSTPPSPVLAPHPCACHGLPSGRTPNAERCPLSMPFLADRRPLTADGYFPLLPSAPLCAGLPTAHRPRPKVSITPHHSTTPSLHHSTLPSALLPLCSLSGYLVTSMRSEKIFSCGKCRDVPRRQNDHGSHHRDSEFSEGRPESHSRRPRMRFDSAVAVLSVFSVSLWFNCRSSCPSCLRGEICGAYWLRLRRAVSLW
jgi:hypothetical protein